MSLNLLCPINQLGFGQVGLHLALALERLGCLPAWWPIGGVEAHPRYHGVLRQMQERAARYDPSAPSLRIYHQFDLACHVGKGVHAALVIFELDRFTPREKWHLDQQDVLFVPSEWGKRVLERSGVKPPVHVCPFGVDTQVFRPVTEPRPKAGPTIFFNAGKWELRKGHDLLVEAFNDAFTEQDEVELWMLTYNPVVPRNRDQYNAEWARLYLESRLGRAGKIKLLPRVATQDEVAGLMRAADCGVFPSRAEGWGMESAEMLAMGKDVILTYCSAHTEYADEDNAMLIDVDEPEEAHDGVWFDATAPHWQGQPGQWARLGERQKGQLVAHLRTVHRIRQNNGCMPVNQHGIDRFRRLTWDNTGCILRRVLLGGEA